MKGFEGKSFVAGVLCSVAVAGLVIPAFAVATGAMTPNRVNIIANGETLSQAGENYALQTGTSVPSSITYEDENGGWTVYLPVRRISEALNVDIGWNSSQNAVVIGEGANVAPPDTSTDPGVSSIVYYDRYPGVPDFGAFAGIPESDIGDLAGIDGYYYDVVDVDDAQSKNADLLTEYQSLLTQCGFSYIGEFEGGNGPVVCYSNGQISIGVGVINPRFFAVVPVN